MPVLDLGQVVGPPGKQGEQGVQGVQGNTGPQGVQGANGITPNIQVGTVTTLPPGSDAYFTRQEDSPDAAPVFDVGLPRGADSVNDGDMKAAMYDPTGKEEDVFAYADAVLAAAKAYAQQYGFSKEQSLKAATCKILGIQDTSTPDDAFLKLAVGTGNYIYFVHAQLDDGTPVANSAVSGLTEIPGFALTTDENGDAVGSSASTNPSISVASPYVDYNPGTVTASSAGISTQVTITLQKKTGPYFSMSSSKKYKFSPSAQSVDLTAVGAGGGGGESNGNTGTASAGGGGGYVATKLNVALDESKELEVQIGDGGYHFNKGGATKVLSGSTEILSASGGNTASGTSPGSGNGNGGSLYQNGHDASGYIFNDSSLGLAGGGGGGGGGPTTATSSPTSGGNPRGGKGGYYDGSTIHSSEYGMTPGGGGGGETGHSNRIGRQGGSGMLYCRVHYKEEA